MSEPAKLLTIEEFSRHSRLSVATIHRLKKAGRIVCFQPGGKGSRILFPANAIERQGGTTAASAPPAVSHAGQRPQLSGPAPAWKRNPVHSDEKSPYAPKTK